jgi:hypothetical protein
MRRFMRRGGGDGLGLLLVMRPRLLSVEVELGSLLKSSGSWGLLLVRLRQLMVVECAHWEGVVVRYRYGLVVVEDGLFGRVRR